MSTRSIDEIQADVRHATRINDADALMSLAVELDAVHTPQAEALANRSRGWALFCHGDYTAALSHYDRALALNEELGDRSSVAAVTGNIGGVHRSTGDYPAALSHYHRALALYEELGDRNGIALVTGNIGNVHAGTGDYPAALSHYHRALALHEELGDRIGIAGVTSNIGIVLKNTGDNAEALSQYFRALALREELGDRSGVATVTGNIGIIHYTTGDYAEALSHFHRAMAIHEELGNRNGVARFTGNILAVYVQMGSDTEAHELLATMDGMHIDDPTVRITREQARATLQERSGDLDGAAATLQQALNQAREHGARSYAAEMHKALRDLALKQNNLAGYVEHNNEYTRITEEVNGKEATLKMAMQAKQREIDAREREHAQHMAVLHSTLPKHITDRVAHGETVNDHYDNAAVIFLDIVDFTAISDSIPSDHVVHLLDQIFTTLDAVCEKHNVVKIKTIGDSYMAVAFPLESSNSEQRAASAAIDMLHAVSHIVSPTSSPKGSPIQVRIGMHSGPVTAGVIGTQRMQYDVWGDTVNVASRMERSSEPGRIHVSSSFALALQGEMAKEQKGEVDVIPGVSEEQGVSSQFPVSCSLIERGAIDVKGKGMMNTYWLE